MTDKLTDADKKQYFDAINVLFDGAVHISPDDINETLCRYTDQMIYEIANCSKAITAFAFNTFYSFTFAHFTKYAIEYTLAKWVPGISLLHEFSRWSATEALEYHFSGFLADWVAQLTRKRQFIGCVYSARVKWRSAFEMEILGI